MSSLQKKLLVKPGAKIKLREVDPDFHDDHKSHKEAQSEIDRYLEKMNELQYLLYAEGKHSLLVVLQGLDAAGKDGVVRHVFTGMNPAGCRVAAFKVPSSLELRHDFLWRIHAEAPAKGEVVVFNRSHYEDVLVARVHQLVEKKVWSRRYDRINEFERLLREDNQTQILKFYLHISPEEQMARFKKRLDDPARQWKISEADYKERGRWDDYIEAFEAMLHKTSTEYAPWYVIPSNHKWFRNLAVSRIITETLEGLNLKAPKPTIDLDAIRREYHAAAKSSRK